MGIELKSLIYIWTHMPELLNYFLLLRGEKISLEI